jgi:hypothetical protein
MGANEDAAERLDRELDELLNEMRVLLPGPRWSSGFCSRRLLHRSSRRCDRSNAPCTSLPFRPGPWRSSLWLPQWLSIACDSASTTRPSSSCSATNCSSPRWGSSPYPSAPLPPRLLPSSMGAPRRSGSVEWQSHSARSCGSRSARFESVEGPNSGLGGFSHARPLSPEPHRESNERNRREEHPPTIRSTTAGADDVVQTAVRAGRERFDEVHIRVVPRPTRSETPTAVGPCPSNAQAVGSSAGRRSFLRHRESA